MKEVARYKAALLLLALSLHKRRKRFRVRRFMSVGERLGAEGLKFNQA